MTIFSGGYGESFDGNSILVKVNGFKYYYIGSEIYSFVAADEIVEFFSPVGNNDVPYPWSMDVNGVIYLMLERVIMTDYKQQDGEDPYNHFYKTTTMNNFKKEIVGSEIYNSAVFVNNPGLNFDSLTSEEKVKVITMVTNDGQERVVNRDEFIALHMEDATEKHFYSLNVNVIIPRK
jgi:hypothetical protein